LAFMCLTGAQFPQILAFSFLNEVRTQFGVYLNDTVLQKRATVRFEMNTFAHQIQHTVQNYTSSLYDLRVLNSSEMQELVPVVALDDYFLWGGKKRSTLVIRHLNDPSLLLHGPSRKTPTWFLSNFLTKHPFLTIGLFIMLAVVVFLYFVVIIHLCGAHFEKTNEHGKPICWVQT